MSDQPPSARRGTNAIALTLCACGGLLAFSLFCRSGPERFILPIEPGAVSALPRLQYLLFDSLGFAAYFFAVEWILLGLVVFGRRSWLHLVRRSLGGLVLLLGAAVVADRLGESPGVMEEAIKAAVGPLAGKGGTIGAAASLWLDRNCGSGARLFLLAAGISLGLILAADRLVKAVWVLVGMIVRLLFAGLARLLTASAAALELAAHALRRAADRLGGPSGPSATEPPIATAPLPTGECAAPPPAKNAGGDNIPIHHHGPSTIPEKEAHQQQPAPPRSFPRVTPSVAAEELASAPPRPYDLPSLELLDEPSAVPIERHEQRLIDLATQLEKACADFGLTVKVVGIHTGPVITQYEISLDVGLRVSKITSLSDDLALHLKVPSVRIVAPIPGKNTVGVEVPNENRANVRLKELVTASPAKVAKMRLPLFFGKDSEGRPLIHDLADMPHLLIAGRTGTGKSVCLNSIILSLLLTRRPDECKLIMIDPKQVELAEYGKLPHLMHPVVTDNKKAEAILSWGVDKMEERYDVLRRARVRNIGSYNELTHDEILRRVRPENDEEKEKVPAKMPYIVIVVDEVGDLMMAMKKEVEGHIIRLAQKSRAAGIHLILTTQRPTVDVITGLIKSNLPARICFQVADRSNSRVVLDEMGAEKLLGKGDMLFLQPNTSTIVRAQGTYASDDEILRVVSQLEVEDPAYDAELMRLEERLAPGKAGLLETIRKRDDLYEEAIEIIIREGRGSVSLLQRALGIGYGRAARLIDFMAEDGIVGHYNGAQARDVLFSPLQWEEMKRGGSSSLAESA